MKITKRERTALAPAVLYRWKIWTFGNRLFWDADPTLPFRAEKTLEALVRKGLMVRELGDVYRATGLARSLQCPSCQSGKLYEEDTAVGNCEKCQGTGLRLESIDRRRKS